MDRIEKYILMYQDDEVLSFEVTFGKRNQIKLLERLAHYDKAPYGINDDISEEERRWALFKFFNGRTIPATRWDYQKILDNTGCKDEFELSFKGHGLSLTNHYWVRKEDEHLKYADINFFTNKWDDSFAKAVLSGNYEALKNVDLNVPDIVTQGWAVKGWLCEDCPTLYKLGIAEGHVEESLSEVLVSRLAARMLGQGEALEYQLKDVYGHLASASTVMIGIDEELVPLSSVLPNELYAIYRNKSHDRKNSEEFFKRLKECGINHAHEFFVKVMCLRSLCFVNDLHFDNLSMIRNNKTGEIRFAPLYDLAGAFGSSQTGRNILSNINKATYMIVYFVYSDLSPDWDYSWFNPHSLDGFENDIREVLSISDFYTPELIDNIIDVYQHQKASLIELWKKAKK